MNAPEPLQNESPKAYAAFVAYVEQGDNRSTGKVARQLGKSRQLIQRWSSKYRWQERMEAQRLRECQQKIAAEERATEKIAEITESERAHVARRCFDVANRFINRADEILEEHPTSAVRLLAVGADVAQAVGGVASGYGVPANVQSLIHIETIEQYVDEHGNPTKAPPEITSLEQADAVIAEYESKKRELPCDN